MPTVRGIQSRRFTIAWLVLVVSAVSLLGCQRAYAIPDSNMIDVPYRAQETGYYCGVASVQMALYYVSGDVTPQDTLAKELKTEPKEGTWTNKMRGPFNLRGYRLVWEAHTTLDELKKQNSRGYVSIILIWWDTDRKDGHYVVVVGYNATGIFVNDPNPTYWEQPKSRRTGEKAFISKKLLSNLWTNYEQWALEIPYKPGVYALTLSVTGIQDAYQSGPVTVVIDGEDSGQIKSGEPRSFYFKLGTSHTISVDEYVSGPEGTRYYTAKNTITITGQETHGIEYVEQFRLLVETEPSSVAPAYEKWSTPGETETLGPYEEIVSVDGGTRFFFAGLTVDGTLQETGTMTLRMDQPHTVKVRYITQYFLRVASDFGDPKGEGWYASGDVATYSVTTTQGLLIRKVFMSWTGDIASAQPQGTLTMTRPYTIEAEWRDDYTQLVFVLFSVPVVVVAIFITRRKKPQQPASPL